MKFTDISTQLLCYANSASLFEQFVTVMLSIASNYKQPQLFSQHFLASVCFLDFTG